MKKPERVIVNQKEVEALTKRLSSGSLTDTDKQILAGILQFYLWLQWALQETKLSVNRLRALFGFRKTEKRCNLPPSLERGETLAKEALDKKKTWN